MPFTEDKRVRNIKKMSTVVISYYESFQKDILILNIQGLYPK